MITLQMPITNLIRTEPIRSSYISWVQVCGSFTKIPNNKILVTKRMAAFLNCNEHKAASNHELVSKKKEFYLWKVQASHGLIRAEAVFFVIRISWTRNFWIILFLFLTGSFVIRFLCEIRTRCVQNSEGKKKEIRLKKQKEADQGKKTHTYTYSHTNVWGHTQTHTHTDTHAHKHIHTQHRPQPRVVVCVCPSMRVSACVCVYVCVCMSVRLSDCVVLGGVLWCVVRQCVEL